MKKKKNSHEQLCEIILLFLSFLEHCNGIQMKVDLILKSRASHCLKIVQKVSFNIASKASYVYILSGQKFIKNAKNCSLWRVFESLKLEVKQCYQTGDC